MNERLFLVLKTLFQDDVTIRNDLIAVAVVGVVALTT